MQAETAAKKRWPCGHRLRPLAPFATSLRVAVSSPREAFSPRGRGRERLRVATLKIKRKLTARFTNKKNCR